LAQETVDEQITRLEEELSDYNDALKEQARLKSSEEGSSSSRFMASYDNPTLKINIKEIRVQLTTLYNSKKAGY